MVADLRVGARHTASGRGDPPPRVAPRPARDCRLYQRERGTDGAALAAFGVVRGGRRALTARVGAPYMRGVMAVGESSLAERLAARAAGVDATVAYTVRPLDGGEAIRANGDLQLPTASAFKLYLLAALYAADVAARLSLDTRVVLHPDDVARGSGVLKLLDRDARLTLRDHARLMIVVSDNTATNTVMRALGGPAAADAAVQALPVALAQTRVGNYITFASADPNDLAASSPDDFTALLAALAAGTCTGSTAHDAEIGWTLRRQQHRSMIPRDLPCSEYAEEFGIEEDVRCGSKSGSMPGVRADVGLVETRARRWAIAVQVLGQPDFNTGDNHPYNRLIADLSRLVFDAWGR